MADQLLLEHKKNHVESTVIIGRPTLYSSELANRICGELAMGRSLNSICKNDEGMPVISTVFKWLSDKKEFSDKYARAKEESVDAMAEEILDISDDGSNDWMEHEIASGRVVVVLNNEAVQRSKLRVDTRKWIMSKMKPKKYGDKLDLSSGGKVIQGNVIVVKDFSKKNNATDNK